MSESRPFGFSAAGFNSSPSFLPGDAARQRLARCRKNSRWKRKLVIPSQYHHRPPPPPPPTLFSGAGCFGVAENANKDDSSMDEKPEPTKTKLTTPSAVTGEIPCYFQGSNYSSQLSPPTSFTFTPDEPMKKETEEKPERKLASTQIVLVSRILKGIPQTPHFLPLKSYSNVAKQRLINAWDNIFEETVDKLLSLQVNGFWVAAKRLWETMEELENMGYNVIMLRRRLVELRDVIVSRRRSRSEIMRLKDEAEQHRLEKSRLEYEILKLRAKVEGEQECVDDIIGKVAKMEDEMPHFNDVFAKIAIELF